MIQFIHEDGDLIVQECKAFLEALANKTIAPSDPEMLLINGWAYRELMMRAGVNYTGNQNLVSFSTNNSLEELGYFFTTYRLSARPSFTTIRYILDIAHPGVIIPIGNRIRTEDGLFSFGTRSELIVPPGTTTVDVIADCLTTGVESNGYAPNKVNVIQDPVAYVIEAYNIDMTNGGASEETDDQLRNRIMLAPSKFSVAGPDDAYVYWAMTAHPSIVDVKVTNPEPGHVAIYPLITGGELPTPEIISAVQAICNHKKVRPLSDIVNTYQPNLIEYDIVVDITIMKNENAAQVKSDVLTALGQFKNDRLNKLGRDVIKEQLISVSMLKDRVYKANPTSPASDIIIEDDTFSKCNSITVNVIGIADE